MTPTRVRRPVRASPAMSFERSSITVRFIWSQKVTFDPSGTGRGVATKDCWALMKVSLISFFSKLKGIPRT